MLTTKDMARLNNRLQVPLIIQDILDGQETLSGDVQYALHEILSNYQPDSALLCMALSAKRIAQRFLHLSPTMAVLRMECDRVIEDYAQLWIDHARSRPIDDNMLMDTLMDIPEDLESLADLLETARAFLERKHGEAAALCEILLTQARAQSIVADSFVEMLELETAKAPAALQNNAPAGKSNVIPFPYYARS